MGIPDVESMTGMKKDELLDEFHRKYTPEGFKEFDVFLERIRLDTFIGFINMKMSELDFRKFMDGRR